MKFFSEACERNKIPILNVLRQEFPGVTQVLEIGSGSGQHAVFFGEQLPHLRWQTSDLEENHSSIQAWIKETDRTNVFPPLLLDVNDFPKDQNTVDAVFSANTAHIMAWGEVRKMFQGVGKILRENGVFCLYGPFNYDGNYTSESNARFDRYLKSIHPQQGIREFEELVKLAEQNHLIFQKDYSLPAHNHLLAWKKITP